MRYQSNRFSWRGNCPNIKGLEHEEFDQTHTRYKFLHLLMSHWDIHRTFDCSIREMGLYLGVHLMLMYIRGVCLDTFGGHALDHASCSHVKASMPALRACARDSDFASQMLQILGNRVPGELKVSLLFEDVGFDPQLMADEVCEINKALFTAREQCMARNIKKMQEMFPAHDVHVIVGLGHLWPACANVLGHLLTPSEVDVFTLHQRSIEGTRLTLLVPGTIANDEE